MDATVDNFRVALPAIRNTTLPERIFLQGPHTRTHELRQIIRVAWEMLRGFRVLHFVGPCVTVFGSARFSEAHPYYTLARDVGASLGELGFTVMTGGGPQFSLGFMKPSPAWPFGSLSSFGSPGAGGSLGFADPGAGVGYAYVTSQMGTALTGDPRDVALRDALYSAIPASPALGRLAA